MINIKNIYNKLKNKDVKKYKIYLLVMIIFWVICNNIFSYYKVFNNYMVPTYEIGDHVIAIKSKEYMNGDIVLFMRENKIQAKRIIASQGQEIDFDKNGNVFINGEFMYEPYAKNKYPGKININIPVKLKSNEYFTIGDNRKYSIDSRTEKINIVKKEEIIGKVLFRIYPWK